ncbi:hypothetical protein DAEQUDRAFT_504365 [Daedalea quercina L-15889]|uniref:Uncharacterized protein n=1 Tax=Daedalea quercina L-15889 TaxID=1314783 RepID=A0A165T7V1_9APHY|nr:hypothetical protein DAEQUDRAFT_504365 [Daedalea quercina L-15889]
MPGTELARTFVHSPRTRFCRVAAKAPPQPASAHRYLVVLAHRPMCAHRCFEELWMHWHARKPAAMLWVAIWVGTVSGRAWSISYVASNPKRDSAPPVEASRILVWRSRRCLLQPFWATASREREIHALTGRTGTTPSSFFPPLSTT